ncbi:MAG TPA: isochorismatase family cysteine hydrolase [Polyangiales bacterium]|nr:isochorismatase family cysteine hydrolase [Polyangiales bacterium]
MNHKQASAQRQIPRGSGAARQLEHQGGQLRKTAQARPQSGAGHCLLLVDVINGFDFPGSDRLVHAAERAAPKIQRLSARARAAGVPVVYVNDNFGRWRSDFAATIEACTRPDQPGRYVSQLLRPDRRDYFVLKPQYSGFYGTTLEMLLQHIGARTLVLAGFAANLCVQLTAGDAYIRGYQLIVPSDCTASNTPALTRAALAHVRVALGGRTPAASSIKFAHERGT